MNVAGSGGGGGADSMPRYNMNPSAPVAGQVQVDRRRRKNTNYYNNGPRGSGGGGYRSDGRMGHRAGGDGPHNGNSSGGGGASYRGGDYDQQQSFAPYQMESGGHRSGGSGSHHHHHGGYHQYQHHHQGHNHHHHQNSSGSSLDYEGRGGDGRQQRGDGGSSSTSRIPRHDHSHSHNNHGHRNNGGMQVQGQPQPQETLIHPGHPNPVGASNFGAVGVNGVPVANGGPVPGGGGHQMGTNEIVVVAAHSDHHNHVPITHFPGMPPQFPIPAPAAAPPGTFGLVGFHPNSQPMFGTIAVCHIPYGVNPSSVISPAVFTQIIGSGVFMPGLQYNLQCAFPSPLLPAHPVIIHPQHQHQQHPAQVHQFGGVPGGPGMPGHLPHVSESEECLAFDSSSLNPDADAFFPPAFPPSEDDHDGGDVGSGVSGTSGGGDCNDDDEVGTGEQLKHHGVDQGEDRQDIKHRHSGETSARSDENENIVIEIDRNDIPVVSAASPRSDGEN